MNTLLYTQFIKKEARRLGFDYCGIAKAERLNADADKLEQWLKKGFQGSMQYMENNFEKRVNPRLLVEGAQSVISLLINYYPSTRQDDGIPKISKYAYGNDYHEVIRAKLNELLQCIREYCGDVNGRGFVDSAPVLERSWAIRSGAGWVGRNGNLITKKQGSFFFIATLIIDLPLLYDNVFQHDYCGTCTKCIDACPTQAIKEDKEIDGSQCISYYTIELKDAIIQRDQAWNDWIFGCDVCQDVCPWNRFSLATSEIAFQPLSEILHYTAADWSALKNETFNQVFKNSPLKRSKLKGMIRNLSFINPQK